ncbi:MAG: VRR-NUC domain-containing protein [Elusimicrobia bacterium]|nr:VRR-NUC domain-containing protein [Elusimicrobiota bacterium]
MNVSISQSSGFVRIAANQQKGVNFIAAEKQFENRVKKWLQQQGIYPLGYAADKMEIPPIGYYEKRWGGGYSKKGLPDMHLVANGISVDLELKAPNGKPSDLQIHNIIQINQAGSIALLLFPDGFEQFKEIMKGVINCNSVIPLLNALKAANASINCDTLTSWK